MSGIMIALMYFPMFFWLVYTFFDKIFNENQNSWISIFTVAMILCMVAFMAQLSERISTLSHGLDAAIAAGVTQQGE